MYFERKPFEKLSLRNTIGFSSQVQNYLGHFLTCFEFITKRQGH